MKRELRILTPLGMLGYGFPIQWFEKGLEMEPHAITVDAGSTDSGPQKLALGLMTCSYEAYYDEIEILLLAGQRKHIPVFISSAGGDGSNIHVDLFVQIVEDICAKHDLHLKLGVIYSEPGKDLIRERLNEGRVSPCGPVPQLTEEDINDATVIVAQMGVEPYLKMLDEHPDIDVIISGRTYDPVPTAAFGIKNGYDPALCWHMGKIMECGALCATPAGKSILGTLTENSFTLEPLNPAERCTPYSVAAHTMYEKSHPYYLPGPGGRLDLSGCSFEQVNDRVVRVSGSRFEPTTYTVKLEGSKVAGERAICVAGIRDPILISQIYPFLDKVKKDVLDEYSDMGGVLLFHIYGKNGVMSVLEPEKDHVPLELCVIIETVAPTEKIAVNMCNRARVHMLHYDYEGRIATAGNIALPFTPLEIPLGKVCEFNVYHTMELNDSCEVFPMKVLEI